MAEIGQARALDPLAPIVHAFAGMILAGAGRLEEGFAAVRHALTLDPDFFPAHSTLGHLYELAGTHESALEQYRSAYRLSGGNVFQLALQALPHVRLGRTSDAVQIAATLEQVAQSCFVPPCAFALVYAALDDRESALRWLTDAHRLRDVFFVFLPNAFWWESLRGDGRFDELLRAFPSPP